MVSAEDALRDVLELLLEEPLEQHITWILRDRPDDLPVLFASAVGLLQVLVKRRAADHHQTKDATLHSILDELRKVISEQRDD